MKNSNRGKRQYEKRKKREVDISGFIVGAVLAVAGVFAIFDDAKTRGKNKELKRELEERDKLLTRAYFSLGKLHNRVFGDDDSK